MNKSCRAKLIISLSALLLAQTLMVSYPSLAHSATLAPQFSQARNLSHSPMMTSGARSNSLNLGSSQHNTSIAGLNAGQNYNIKVGGSTLTVSPTSQLTQAEKVAVMQVLQGGHQSLILAANGSASGGSMILPPSLSSKLSNLLIPKNVSVTVFNANAALNLSGTLHDSGKLYLSTANASALNFVLSASNINIGAQGQVSTILPSNNSYALQANVGIGLTINAGNSFTNAGIISTQGNLNLQTGSGTIKNSGLISSQAGSINISASDNKTALKVDGSGGTFQALNGSINLRNAYTGSADITLTSGDYLAQSLNASAGTGNVLTNLNRSTAVINASGTNVDVQVNSGVLRLGAIDAIGDPSAVNFSTAGIDISGTSAISGAPFVIISGGDIFSSTSVAIATSSTSGNGGNIIMVAGAAGSGTNPVTVTGPSTTGGNINLPNITALDSSSSSVNGTGGSITLVAFAPGGGSSTKGLITLPSGITINTNGGNGGAGGNFVAVAGASTNATAISVGSVITGGGKAQFINAQQVSALSVDPTTGTFGVLSLGGPIQSAGITTGMINTAGQGGNGAGSTASTNGSAGGLLRIVAGGTISTGALLSFGGGAGGTTKGFPASSGGAGGVIQVIGSASADITIDGDVNSSGGAGGSAQGSKGSGGSAGNITISGAGNTMINGVVLAASGGDGMVGSANGAGAFGGGAGGAGGANGNGGGGYFGGGGAGGFIKNAGGGGGGGGYLSGGGGGGGEGNPSGVGGFGTAGGGNGGSAPVFATGLSSGGGGAGGGINQLPAFAGSGTLAQGGQGGWGGHDGPGAGGLAGGGTQATAVGGNGGDSGTSQTGFGVGAASLFAVKSAGAGGSATASAGTVLLQGNSVEVNGTITSSGVFSGQSINAQGLNGSVSIVANNGSIQVQSITAPSISLNASNGNIGSANQPVSVSNGGAGVSLSASASGAGPASGNAWISGNSSSPEALTLSNSSTPLSASTSFNLTQSNGDIIAENYSNLAIASPTINLTASNGNVGDLNIPTSPNYLMVSSGQGGVKTLNLAVQAIDGVIQDNDSDIGANPAVLVSASNSHEFILNQTAGSIGISGTVSAPILVELLANNNIISLNGGTINTNVLLMSASGQIGLNAVYPLLAQASVQLAVESNGSQFINNTGSSTLGAFSMTAVSGGSVNITNTGSVVLVPFADFVGNTNNQAGSNYNLSTLPDINGNSQISIADGVTAGNTIVLSSISSGGGTGGIQQPGGGTLTAPNIFLTDLGNNSSPGNHGIGTSTIRITTFASALNISSPGDIFIHNFGVSTVSANSSAGGVSIVNDGSVVLSGQNSAPNSTFVISTNPDLSSGNGQIILNGGVTARSITLSSSESGAGQGGITGGGLLQAAGVSLSDSGNGSIANGTAPIQTETQELSAGTTGNVSINNIGSVELLAGTASANMFSLSTSPDSSGNGAISLFSLSGILIAATVTLNSSESGSGQGGIFLSDTGAGITATNQIILMDGSGNGSGNIGQTSSPLSISTPLITAATKGSVYLLNQGGSAISMVNTGAVTNSANTYMLVSDGDINVTNNPQAHSIILQTTSGAVNLAASLEPTVDATGNGGSLQITAGTLNSTTSQSITIGADGTGTQGNGGTVIVSADAIFRSGGAIVFSSNGSGSGSGGRVTLTTTAAFNLTPSGISLQATGSSGGSASVIANANGLGSPGQINLLPGGINVSPTDNINGSGGSIALTTGSGGTIFLTNVTGLSVAGNGTGSGGAVVLDSPTISLPGGAPFQINASAGAASPAGVISQAGLIQIITNSAISIGNSGGNQLILTCIGSGTPSNGISIDTSAGTNGITVADSAISVGPAFAFNGNGGNVSLNSGGVIHFDTNAPQFSGSIYIGTNGLGSGSGGNLNFVATQGITYANQQSLPLILNANGGSSGNIGGSGGSIFYSSGLSQVLTVGNVAGGLVLNATGGAANTSSAQGANGGSITVINIDNLIVNPQAVNAAPLGANGNGAALIFEAGFFHSTNQHTNSTLLVNSALSANGKGNGAGGSIILISTSTIPFNIGLVNGNTNGVKGAVTVSRGSTSTGTNGEIAFSSLDSTGFAGLTISVPITAFSQADISSTGFLKIGAALGTVASTSAKANTSSIFINANGAVSQSAATQVLSASNITLEGLGNGTGPLSIGSSSVALVVNTGANLGLLSASAAGIVNLTDKGKGFLTVVNSQAGTNFSLSTAGTIHAATPIIITAPSASSNTINLKTTSGAISLEDNVSAPGGTITLSSTAGITDTGGSGTFSVNASTVILNGGTQAIGSSSIPLRVTASTLTANTSGNIWLNSLGANELSFAGTNTKGSFALDANSKVTIAAAMTTPSSISINPGSGNNINITKVLGSATGSVNLTVTGSGQIQLPSAGAPIVLSAKSISISSDFPLAAPFLLKASNLQLDSAGAIDVTNVGTTPMTLGSSGGQSFNLVSSGPVTLAGLVLGSAIKISGKSITIGGIGVGADSTSTVELDATGAGAISGTGPIDAATVTLSSGSGAIGPLLIGAIADVAVAVSTTGPVNINNGNNTKITVNVGPKLPASSFTVNSSGSIKTSGDLLTPTSITLATSGSAGDITFGGNLGGSKTTTINLTTSGSGQILENGFQPTAANINLNTQTNIGAGSGSAGTQFSINASSSVSANSTGVVNLKNVNPTAAITLKNSNGGSGKTFTLETNGSLTTSGNISISNFGAIILTSLLGGITVNGLIGGPTAGDIVLNADKGSISKGTSSTALIQTSPVSAVGLPSALTLNSSLNIGSGSAIKISTSQFDTIAPAGLVNIQNTLAGSSELVGSTSKGSFTLTTAGSTLIDQIATTSGSIKVTESVGTLSTAQNANISAVGGSLTLLNLDTSLAGKIEIGPDANITTSGTGGGNVSILIGATTTKQGPIPIGPQFNRTPPPANLFLFGPNGINATSNQIFIQSVGGAKVIFNAGSKGNITIDAPTSSTLIQADPPMQTAVITPGIREGLTPAIQLKEEGTIDSGHASNISSAMALPHEANMGTNQQAISIPQIPQVHIASSAIQQAELLESAMKFTQGVNSTQGNTIAHVSRDNFSALDSASVLDVDDYEGARLLAPSSDITIETPLAHIKIAAGSLVYVISKKSSVAVLNFDDKHAGSVKVVSASGKEIELTPGESLILSAAANSDFEHANLVSSLSYRNLRSHNLGVGLSAFTAEFSVPVAIQTIGSVKRLLQSTDKRAKHISAHMLKTVAANMQVRARGGAYQQSQPLSKMAWTNDIER